MSYCSVSVRRKSSIGCALTTLRLFSLQFAFSRTEIACERETRRQIRIPSLQFLLRQILTTRIDTTCGGGGAGTKRAGSGKGRWRRGRGAIANAYKLYAATSGFPLVRQVFPESAGRLGQILDFGRGEVAGRDLGVDLDAAVGRDKVFGDCRSEGGTPEGSVDPKGGGGHPKLKEKRRVPERARGLTLVPPVDGDAASDNRVVLHVRHRDHLRVL